MAELERDGGHDGRAIFPAPGDGDRDRDRAGSHDDGNGDRAGSHDDGDGGAGRGDGGALWITYRRPFREWVGVTVRSGLGAGFLAGILAGAVWLASTQLGASDLIVVDVPALPLRVALGIAGGASVAGLLVGGVIGAMPLRTRAVGGTAADVAHDGAGGDGPAVARGTDGRRFEAVT